MASNPNEEQPPPYAQDAYPLQDLRPAEVPTDEALPKYPADPPLLARLLSQRRRWYKVILATLLVIVVVSATVGGVFRSNHSESQQTAESADDPPDPIITALTAAECSAGTFVFYQTNTTDIFLHGQLRNGYWNGTSSSEIPSMKLDLVNTSLRPMYGTNVTAVAYTNGNLTNDETDIVIRLYYLSFGSNNADLAIVEATLNLPFPNTSATAGPSIPITQQIIANLSNPSSLSACYVEDAGIYLYYLTSPTSSGAPNTTPATLTQMTWTSTSLWSQPSPLNATALNSGAGLAVAGVHGPEIHIFFMDESNSLAMLIYTNSTWGPAVQIGSSNYYQPAAEQVTNFAAVAPYVDPTQVRLYFLVDHVLVQFVIDFNADTEYYSYGPPEDISAAPAGIQAPPLIAAASGVFGGQLQISVFYVWKFTEGETGVQGSTIVNFTDAQGAWVQEGWNATVLDVVV